MKLKEQKKVGFDPIAHQYIYNGKELIGVTSLLKKYHLSADYTGISEETLSRAADKGTALHRLLEDYDNGKTIVTKTDAEKKTISDYKKLGLTHLASEFLVSDLESTATFIDKIFGVGENEVEISDVKTTSQLHNTALAWQLSIGKYLFLLANPKVKVARLSVLWFDKNTGALKDYRAVREIPEHKVKALLECVKMDLPYSDDDDATPELSLVLNGSEVAEYVDIATRLQALKATIDALSEKKKEYDAKVIEYMRNEGLTTLKAQGGEFRIKKGSVRVGIDTKALQADHPDLAEKYKKESIVAPSLTFVPNAVQPE